MSLWNFRVPCGLDHRSAVSILVLVDVALELGDDDFPEHTCISFNPCSRGCRSGTGGAARPRPPSSGVSILVLVDVALELGRAREQAITEQGFQSLFSWMSLWNKVSGTLPAALVGVSILVLVDVALELVHFTDHTER